MNKPYLLNGEPVTFQRLIKAAQDEGFYQRDSFYTTSEAAAFLRRQGHVIEDNLAVSEEQKQ